MEEGKIEQLQQILNISKEESKFLLEASNYSIESAVQLHSFQQEDQPEQEQEESSHKGKEKQQEEVKQAVTFKNEKNKEKQQYYSGGQQSGMIVESPSNFTPETEGGPEEDLLQKLLKHAQMEGQRRMEEGSEHPSAGSKEKKKLFLGTGYKLGSQTTPSQPIQTQPRSSEEEEDEEVVERTLHLWRNGFSIDDGPLMSSSDPENKKILQQIMAGSAPLKIFNVRPNQQVEIRLDPRMNDDYVEPKRVLKPFSGQGQRLGSIVPSTSASTTSAASSATSTTSNAPQIQLDPNQPVITVPIRLKNGQRVVLKLNPSHTLRDIFYHVRSISSVQQFSLSVGIPPVVYEEAKDGDSRVGDLNINNTIMNQK